MPQYLLLLYNEPNWLQKLSPEEMQKATEKYMAWKSKPFVRGGTRLTLEAGRVIRAQNGKARAMDGPYSETKEILGGSYTIEAPDYDQAVQFSLDHPHLDYGGTIEVRQIFAM